MLPYLEEVSALKIRMKFTKTGTMRFIGHLDIMRYFQKLMRRAKVDIKYSEGFNPHQVMSFAQPLGLGDTSEGEYVDIEVLSTETSEEMLRRINECTSEEIQVRSWVRIADETRRSNAMSLIAAADYLIFARHGQLDAAAIEAMMAQDSICVVRKTKKKEEEADIRPMIYKWEMRDDALFVQLATGSAGNCKPDAVMDAYDAFRGVESEPFAYHFHRLEMYARQGEELVPMDALGKPVLEAVARAEEK